jgi:hypothetical protein
MRWRVCGIAPGRLLLACVLMLFVVAALSAWYYMPIFPDEIAFRLHVGRYIQDQGVVRGLYPLCVSNVKTPPLLFITPAWLLSWLDLTLSPVEMRILPFVSILAAMALTIWHAVRGANPYAALLSTAALTGVAGSGLILARYEYVQALNIACCLGALHFQQSLFNRMYVRYGLAILLFVCGLFSLYVHIQGLLFLPLTLYLAWQLIHTDFGKIRAGFVMLMLFVLMTQTALGFHLASCAEYPEIERFWAGMTFHLRDLASVRLGDWLAIKLDKYLLSFLYKQNYAIDYLPGIRVDDAGQQRMLVYLNQCIRFILSVNLLLCIFIAAGAAIFLLRRFVARHALRTSGYDCEHATALILLALPVIFLFFYDNAQNFYRSFFLNFVIAILLSLCFSRISRFRMRVPVMMYSVLCVAVVLASLAVNAEWFTDKLQAGYEGPSLALSRDWAGVDRDVAALVQDCGMDLTRGGIVVDDMTYNSLKRYPRIYAATYVQLSADVIKSTSENVIKEAYLNYAIARCDNLRGTGIGFQQSRNILCCGVFPYTEK